ncbi:MAG: putative toxin-antitoxin system toxin component, PIN family [Fimbriimonadaceae bacterium]|nr:putative toxin-antitoxin system toxin component, PIN family [Fimbriimonadaceae bacterium]
MNPDAVVFDCMVFVQIVASKGTSYRCYQHVTDSAIPLLASPETLGELRSVLDRPELQRKLPGITPARVDALMHHLSELAVLVHPVPGRLQFPPDPKDEPYINLAIEGRAAYLVTRDRALLRLSDPDDSISEALQAIYPALQVLVPEAFLALGGDPSAAVKFC